MKSVMMRKFLCGKPVILIDNGQVLTENLRRTRVTLDELSGHLREKDVMDFQSVQYAILETDGNLSVFPFPKEVPASAKDAGVQVKPRYLPVTLVTDGCLIRENLARSGKDRQWVEKVLSERGVTLQQTLLLTVDKEDHIYFLGREQA